MAPPTLRPLSVGEILDVSFTLYRRHFAPLAGVALVCSGIPVVLNIFIEAAGGMLANLSLVVVYYVVFAALNSIATAATVFIVSESYLGRPIDARTALRLAARYIGKILVCSLLMTMMVFVGFLFFVIPGIVLISGLILAIPALVIEPGLGPSAALSRSWELTRGSRWRMLGLLLVLTILLYVPIAAIGGIVALFVPGAGSIFSGRGVALAVATAALSGLVQVFIYPLFYCVLTVAYYDLRVRKEGFDLEVLASTLLTA
jgi:glycerophosphoryl diester phosphodiesterase family protein